MQNQEQHISQSEKSKKPILETPTALVWLRRAISLLLLLLCAWAAWHWHQDLSHLAPNQRSLTFLAMGCAVYYVCLVTPFLPGVELGLSLMMLFGWQGIAAVYLTTQLGLNSAFWLGRLWHHPWQDQLVQGIHSKKLPRLLSWGTDKIRLHPAIALILLLNLPGNAILGGGGGLGMLYGLLKLLNPLQFLLATLLATSPAVLFFLLYPLTKN